MFIGPQDSTMKKSDNPPAPKPKWGPKLIQRGELREISEVHSIASRVGHEQPTSSNRVRTKRSKVLFLASYVAGIVALIVIAQYAVSVWKLNRLAELTTIPTFTEQKINYTHKYVNTVSAQ